RGSELAVPLPRGDCRTRTAPRHVVAPGEPAAELSQRTRSESELQARNEQDGRPHTRRCRSKLHRFEERLPLARSPLPRASAPGPRLGRRPSLVAHSQTRGNLSRPRRRGSSYCPRPRRVDEPPWTDGFEHLPLSHLPKRQPRL